MDNLNIHRQKTPADVFGAEMAAEVWDRFTVHYTPTHGSWLNPVEIEIGIFSRQCLGSRRIPDLRIRTLRQEAKARNRRMNRANVKIAWKFDRKPPVESSVIKGNFSRADAVSPSGVCGSLIRNVLPYRAETSDRTC